MNKYSLSVIAVDDRQTPVMLIGQHYYAIADLNPAPGRRYRIRALADCIELANRIRCP